MKTNLCLTLICGAALMGAFLSSSQADAQCVMSFSGRIHTTFEDDLAEELGIPDRNLEDAEVRVQGAQRYGTWTTYDTDRTDRIGRFTASKRFNRRHPCNEGRYIRVQVRFRNADFQVSPVRWHTIFDSRHGSGRHTYNGFIFNNLGSIDIDGGGQAEGGSALAQLHANLWALFFYEN